MTTKIKKNPYRNFPLHESLKNSYVDLQILNGEKREFFYPDNALPVIKANVKRVEFPPLDPLPKRSRSQKKRK